MKCQHRAVCQSTGTGSATAWDPELKHRRVKGRQPPTRACFPQHLMMSLPDPKTAPDAFTECLKAENLDLALSAFRHYQSRPEKASDGRLDETKVTDWCERTDILLVNFLHHPLSLAEHCITSIGKA